MISSTAARLGQGFTLAEVMIGASIGSFVLLGVLTTFLMLGRSGVNINSYAAMDAQTRRTLEDFAEDARMANNITFNPSSTSSTGTSITLTLPDPDTAANHTDASGQVTYTWDNTAGSSSFHYFYRVPGTSAATTPKLLYVANVTSFTFTRYDHTNVATTADTTTKRIQINMTVSTANKTVVTATDTTISASFVLRNKP